MRLRSSSTPPSCRSAYESDSLPSRWHIALNEAVRRRRPRVSPALLHMTVELALVHGLHGAREVGQDSARRPHDEEVDEDAGGQPAGDEADGGGAARCRLPRLQHEADREHGGERRRR